MPSKRRAPHNRTTKKTQTIRTRLIEISMKVEDLIYNKKPITEKEAEIYLKEVNSYRPICCTDERSLQVIDKLTRCMKAIIAEQKELRLNYELTDDENSLDSDLRSCASPVYSLPDEDRVLLTQNKVDIFTDVNEVCSNSTNIVVSDKPNVYDDFQLGENIQRFDVTLNQNDNHNDKSIEKILINNNREKDAASNKRLNAKNEDMELHKSLLNLTITDNKLDDELMSIDVESSQSILNNIDPLQYLIWPRSQNLDIDLACSLPINNNIDRSESKNAVQYQDPNLQFNKKSKRCFEKGQFIKSYSIDIDCTQKSSNDYENVDKLQQSEDNRINFPSSSNNIDIQENKNTNEKGSVYKNECKIKNQKAVAFNNDNTILLPKNKVESNMNMKVINKKLKIEQITANLLKHTNNSEMSKNKLKHTSNIGTTVNPQASTSTNLVESIQLKHHLVTDNTKVCAAGNNKCYPWNSKQVVTNIKTSMKHKHTPDIIQSNVLKTKSTRIKKKRERKDKTIQNIIANKDKIRKNTPKQNNETGGNESGEYHRKNKSIKQSNTQSDLLKGEMLPIYNEKVTNDLSWVENIRFVREISEDEYDRNLLVGENFWDNYDLPLNFDQNDFL